jgi:hypothetical protein
MHLLHETVSVQVRTVQACANSCTLQVRRDEHHLLLAVLKDISLELCVEDAAAA